MPTREEKDPPGTTEEEEVPKIRVKRKRRRLYEQVTEPEVAVAKPPAKPATRKARAKPRSTAKPAARRKKTSKAVTAARTEALGERKKAALETVERHAFWSAGLALVPVPLVNLAALSLMQLKMLRTLTEIYGIEYSRKKGKIYIAALLGFILPASLLTRCSGLLIVLRIVAPLAGALAFPAVAWASTYAVGKVFMRHFERGGTLRDFEPEDSLRHLKRLYTRAKSRPEA